MCGIFNIIRSYKTCYNHEVDAVLKTNALRGVDGMGMLYKSRKTRPMNVVKELGPVTEEKRIEFTNVAHQYECIMGNFRAQPLPEIPSTNKNNLHPFCEGDRVYVVHNGTIANDEQLVSKYGFDKVHIDSQVIAKLYILNMQATNNNLEEAIKRTCRELEGAFACVIYDRIIERFIVFRNYKTLNVHYIPGELFSVSSEVPLKNTNWHDDEYSFLYTTFPTYTAVVVNPNSILITHKFKIESKAASKFIPAKTTNRCVGVCSGGLDSSTSVFIAKKMLGYDDMYVVNMNLGQRGWKSEKKSSQVVADRLGGKYTHVDIRNVFSKLAQTPLTDYTKSVDVTKHGAEACLEWVPVRNTILISIAAGIAESVGASAITSGVNLEEESAYPDNDLAYIKGFDETLRTGSLRGLSVLPLISHLMKRDIVTLGTALDVPFEATTSCYDPIRLSDINDKEKVKLAKSYGLNHLPCGHCGCCSLRRHAFITARIKDPLETLYLNPPSKFPAWDYYMEQINKLGYIEITDDWKERTIEYYRPRILTFDN